MLYPPQTQSEFLHWKKKIEFLEYDYLFFTFSEQGFCEYANLVHQMILPCLLLWF